MKIIYWIKRNWLGILLLAFVAWCMYSIVNGMSSPDTKAWLQKPLSEIRLQDILIIAVIHAWISKSEVKCDCKK